MPKSNLLKEAGLLLFMSSFLMIFITLEVPEAKAGGYMWYAGDGWYKWYANGRVHTGVKWHYATWCDRSTVYYIYGNEHTCTSNHGCIDTWDWSYTPQGAPFMGVPTSFFAQMPYVSPSLFVAYCYVP